MFLSSSSLIYERLYLVTLGATCRYAIAAEDGGLTISDPGASLHVAALEERLARLRLSLNTLERVLVTHLDADRIGGIPLLRRISPRVKVVGTAAMRAALSDEAFTRALYEKDQTIASWFNAPTTNSALSYDEFKSGLKIDKLVGEGDCVTIDEDLSIRCVTTPGHRAHSMAYLLTPHGFVIVDETFGYFRGRELAAPGGDTNVNEALNSVKKFNDIELSGIGFSYGGAVTGALAKRHINSLHQNTEDLIAEVLKARKTGFSEQEIAEQVRAGFYTPQLQDPCLRDSFEQTFQAVTRQLSRLTN